MTADLTLDFSELFAGRRDAVGLGRGGVDRVQLRLDHYGEHLRGIGSGIGIFPMLDDSTVWFAAIDLDEPNFELADQLTRFYPREAPAWIERSRSGNAHVWAFFAKPVPAWAARGVLRYALEAVDRPDVEVFPKQDVLREGMVGNYINLPYHGRERPILDPHYSASIGAKEMPLQRFIRQALAQRHDPESWVRRARSLGARPPEERETAAEFGTAPVLHECAAYILEHRDDNPLRPGYRAAVLFHVAVQLLNWRDITEREARELVHELNDAGTEPASPHEVNRQFDNALSGRFTYTGCDDPLMAPYVSPTCLIAKGEIGG